MILATDYGVIADGVTDNTVTLNNLLETAECLGEKKIQLPSGRILISGPISVNNQGVILLGENRLSTTIVATHSSGNILELNGWYSEARDVGFDSCVLRISGDTVHLKGAHTRIRDFKIEKDVVGIHLTGAGAEVHNGLLGSGLAHSTRILVDGGDTSQIIDGVLIGAQDAPFPDYGIRVVDSAALTITNTRVLTAGVGLALLPSTGCGVHSMFVSDSFFDSGTTGIMIAPVKGGNVSRCRWSGCWTGGGTANGVDIHTDGSTSTISGVHFSDHHSINNALSGFSIGTKVEDFSLLGGEVSGNDFGLWFAEGAMNFRVQNTTIGYGAGMVPNRKWGVFISNYCGNYQITGNTILYNGGGGCNKITDAFGKVDNIG